MSTTPLDELRTIAGRATCVASVLHVWMPFVTMLWAPQYDMRSRCKRWHNRVYKSAAEIPLKWVLAFVSGVRGTLTRTYYLEEYLSEGLDVEIVTDASPQRGAGCLVEDGVVKEYFAMWHQPEDADTMEVTFGTHHGQQVWEAMLMLCALR